MIRITEKYGDTIVAQNDVTDEAAIICLAEKLANYSVMEARRDGPKCYVLAMSEGSQYIVIGDQLPSDNADGPALTPCSMMFEAVGGNAEGFDSLYMMAFFYAAATGAHSPIVGEHMTWSSRITGIHPAKGGQLQPGIVHWHPAT